MTSIENIRYFSENNSNLLSYTFNFIFNTLGFQAKKSSKKLAEFYYGPHCNKLCHKLKIEKGSEQDKPWLEIINAFNETYEFDGLIPFDIINSINFFLTDRGNRGLSQDSFDSSDILLFRKSFQYKYRISQVPIVNMYILLIEKLIKKNLGLEGIPLWPAGKKCAIGLSHDVDNPDKYSRLKWPIFDLKLNKKTLLIYDLLKPYYFSKYILDKNRNDFWLFNDIIEAEEKLGLKSTFFFASVNAMSRYGSIFDVPYDIHSKEFNKIFSELKDNNFEIGLHASYNAYKNPSNFIMEKYCLEKAAKCKVIGLRHHYWHMGRKIEKTLRMHQMAHFKYDTSIAFDDALGFRRNVALPYYPWDCEHSVPISVMQMPVFCMDASLFPRCRDSAEAFEEVKSYINTIKKFKGLGVIDWHVRTSYPRNKEYWIWGEAYLKIIKYLSNDSEIWTTDLGTIYSHIYKRNIKL